MNVYQRSKGIAHQELAERSQGSRGGISADRGCDVGTIDLEYS